MPALVSRVSKAQQARGPLGPFGRKGATRVMIRRPGQPMARPGERVGPLRPGSKVQKMVRRRSLLSRMVKKNPGRLLAGVGDEAELVEEAPLVSNTTLLVVGSVVAAAIGGYLYFNRKTSPVQPNRRRTRRNGKGRSKPQPASGYAYLGDESVHDKNFRRVPDDAWEIVMITPSKAGPWHYLGKRTIDGSECNVWRVIEPMSGGPVWYAQTVQGA